MGAWAALVLWALQVARSGGPVFGLCLFKRITGVPCPTCGGTRAVLRAAEGDLPGALLCNPLVVCGLVILSALMALRLIGGRTVSLGLTARQQRIAWLLLAGLLLLNWAYVVALGR